MLEREIQKTILQEHISIWEAFSIVCRSRPEKTVNEIAVFLKNIEVGHSLKLWAIHKFSLINIPYTEHSRLNDFFTQCRLFCTPMYAEHKESTRHEMRHIGSNIYWKKSDFFNYPPIKALNLLEGKEWLNDNLPVQDNNMGSHTITLGQPDAVHYQRERDQHKQQVEQLQVENEALKQRVFELENKNNSDEPDLLNKIMNSKDNKYYAPDLALAIQLYKHLYIDNTLKDSHSSSANYWITKNTNYDQTKQSGNRIREITAPFIGWNSQRDRKFKK